MESRSLKVWPVAWINRLSSRVTRPHPRLRSFEYSRFLHPFSSRGYAGILQNSNPPFLFLGEEEKRKREFLSAKFILSLRKSSKGFERKIGWSGGKERKARRVDGKIGDGVPTERSARFGRELNRPRLSCYRPLRVIKFPAVFTGQWPRPGRRGIQSP